MIGSTLMAKLNPMTSVSASGPKTMSMPAFEYLITASTPELSQVMARRPQSKYSTNAAIAACRANAATTTLR
jgi:hypothetical protein